MIFLAQQYPEEIAALESDDARQWHSWGNGSHTGCSFKAGERVKTLVGKLRRGRMVFYGVFDGMYPRDTPLRPANERCATAAENGLMLFCSALRASRLNVSQQQPRRHPLPKQIDAQQLQRQSSFGA